VLPFTAEQFHAVFARYNEAIWPVQIAAYAAGAATVVLLFVRPCHADRAIAWILGGLWLWTGAAYHGLYFAGINRAAYLFAGLFVLQAALLVWHAPQLRFAKASKPATGLGAALVVYAAILYPLVGLAAGHGYPATPMFGVTPCPVTLLTFGLLLLAPSAPRSLFAIPLLWSLIGGSAAILLDVPQDWPLLVAGPLTVALLLSDRRERS